MRRITPSGLSTNRPSYSLVRHISKSPDVSFKSDQWTFLDFYLAFILVLLSVLLCKLEQLGCSKSRVARLPKYFTKRRLRTIPKTTGLHFFSFVFNRKWPPACHFLWTFAKLLPTIFRLEITNSAILSMYSLITIFLFILS